MVYRVISTVASNVHSLHDRRDLRRIGVVFQPELVFTLVDLLRIVPVDAVGCVPVGVLLGEAAGCGIVIAGAEIVRTGFLVKVLCTVAERVGIILVRVVLVAEGVVLVGLCACSGAVRKVNNVAMGVVEIIGCVCSRVPADEIRAVKVSRLDRAGCGFTDNIPAVQQEVGHAVGAQLGCADAVCVVGIDAHRDAVDGRARELVPGIVPEAEHRLAADLAQQVAVGVIDIQRDGRNAALRLFSGRGRSPAQLITLL